MSEAGSGDDDGQNANDMERQRQSKRDRERSGAELDARQQSIDGKLNIHQQLRRLVYPAAVESPEGVFQQNRPRIKRRQSARPGKRHDAGAVEGKRRDEDSKQQRPPLRKPPRPLLALTLADAASR